MTQELILNSISFAKDTIEILLPNPTIVRKVYQQQIEIFPETHFPYWSQVWPSAVAMAQFLVENPDYIQHKKVLELAAGLGLPSLIAAKFAKEVYCTDYLQEAISTINQSVEHNKLTNITTGLLDWSKPPVPSPFYDVVLMSDVNYNPPEFEALFSLFKIFLYQRSTIILTTPHRLLAKPFMEWLMPWCKLKTEIEVPHNNGLVSISVMVFYINDLGNLRT